MRTIRTQSTVFHLLALSLALHNPLFVHLVRGLVLREVAVTATAAHATTATVMMLVVVTGIVCIAVGVVVVIAGSGIVSAVQWIDPAQPTQTLSTAADTVRTALLLLLRIGMLVSQLHLLVRFLVHCLSVFFRLVIVVQEREFRGGLVGVCGADVDEDQQCDRHERGEQEEVVREMSLVEVRGDPGMGRIAVDEEEEGDDEEGARCGRREVQGLGYAAHRCGSL